MYAVISVLVLVSVWSHSLAQYHFNLDGNQYKFSFETGDVGDHRREETRDTFGTVIGKYSYIDPNGNRREMRYKADKNGFQPEGYAVHVPELESVVQVPVEEYQVPVQELDVSEEAQLPTQATVEQTVGVTETEAAEATTELPVVTTEAEVTTLRNETEVEPPTTTGEVSQVEGNSVEDSPSPVETVKSLPSPIYPTLLRSPPNPELPLPLAFYHPYRLFNSNVRHAPFLRPGSPGPISFF